jgi:hypothetical protein
MKKITVLLIPCYLLSLLFLSCQTERSKSSDQILNEPLFRYQDIETRWNSFENPTSRKGTGGSENKGAKGHPYDYLKAGESKELMNVKGSGIITRMWFTIRERSPQMLRSLKLEMFWDGADKPAVSAPFGDFFGNGLGRLVAYENALLPIPRVVHLTVLSQCPLKPGLELS